ncbi:MAG TPA: penicillin-binding transpeptidase domain-containing protein, partial [Solirubrobacteraceae bacterium]|nr:penicillin-binding transpeptidase domain-containing protein [Solirubrobacteraceae bacterium]
SYLGYAGGPTASLVAIENSTGQVRAMVGGPDYNKTPFNLATNGERQPGSAFKVFDLAAALEDGISPNSVWSSREKIFIVPNTAGQEKFVVHNDEGSYTGSNTLTGATTFSDNSIYAEVGLKVGTRRIARLAHRMGITTPLSTNPAMTIGGLTVGVTPLDMAHAYETIARAGRRVSGTLAEKGAPVGIQEVDGGGRALPDGARRDVNRVTTQAVLPASIAATETSILETVVQDGTGRAAATGQFAAGKTGTTSNYGDAWFVGWDSRYTVAVWVGYPNGLVPMTNAFNGNPVLGGTYPALIWHNFITLAARIDKERGERAAQRAAERKAGKHPLEAPPEIATPPPSAATTNGGSGNRRSGTATHPSPSKHSAGSPAPSGGGGGETHAKGGSERSAAPESAARAPSAPAAAPAPKPSPPPSSPPAEPPPATGGVSPGGG